MLSLAQKSAVAVTLSISLVTLATTSGCSTGGRQGVEADEVASVTPHVVGARVVPGEIELDRKMLPKKDPEILAEVKDYNSQITDVMVRFVRAPLELEMEHVGGTTWRAKLTNEQIRRLAIGGETVGYQANVIAWNEDGQVAMSERPIEVKIKAPDLAKKEG